MGINPNPWNLSIDLKIVKLRTYEEHFNRTLTYENLALELGLSGHYLPSGKVGKCETRQMEEMKEQLHDWITMTCMESAYHNYLF